MYARVFAVFILTAFCDTTICTSVVTQWIFDNRIENYITKSDLLQIVENVTRIDCAKRCTQMRECVSFFYIKRTDTCRLHSNRFPRGAPFVNAETCQGSKFYTDKCNHGVFHYSKKVNKYFKFKLASMPDRTDALNFCKHLGGTLLMLKTAEDIAAIRDEASVKLDYSLKHGQGTSFKGFWLDAQYDDATGVFRWSDRTAVNTTDSTMWESGAPLYDAKSKCLILVLPTLSNYKFDSSQCAGVQGLVLYPLCGCTP